MIRTTKALCPCRAFSASSSKGFVSSFPERPIRPGKSSSRGPAVNPQKEREVAFRSKQRIQGKLEQLGVSAFDASKLMMRKMKKTDEEELSEFSMGLNRRPEIDEDVDFGPTDSLPSMQKGQWNASGEHGRSDFGFAEDTSEDIHMKMNHLMHTLDEEKVASLMEILNDAQDQKSEALDALVSITKKVKGSTSQDEVPEMTEKELQQLDEYFRKAEINAETVSASSLDQTREEELEEVANQVLDLRSGFKKGMKKAEIYNIEKMMIETFLETPEDAEEVIDRIKLLENMTADQRSERMQKLISMSIKHNSVERARQLTAPRRDPEPVPYNPSEKWIKKQREIRMHNRMKNRLI